MIGNISITFLLSVLLILVLIIGYLVYKGKKKEKRGERK